MPPGCPHTALFPPGASDELCDVRGPASRRERLSIGYKFRSANPQRCIGLGAGLEFWPSSHRGQSLFSAGQCPSSCDGSEYSEAYTGPTGYLAAWAAALEFGLGTVHKSQRPQNFFRGNDGNRPLVHVRAFDQAERVIDDIATLNRTTEKTVQPSILGFNVALANRARVAGSPRAEPAETTQDVDEVCLNMAGELSRTGGQPCSSA